MINLKFLQFLAYNEAIEEGNITQCVTDPKYTIDNLIFFLIVKLGYSTITSAAARSESFIMRN